MRPVRLSVLAALLAGAAPAAAQSFDEAVWANAGLALQYCVAGQAPGATRAAWFRQSGFDETVARSAVNADTTHTFTAPAETVQVELYYGEMPQHCTVTTRHMGVTRAGALLDGLIPQVFPGFVRKLTRGQGAECVSYEDPTNPIGLVIGVVAMDEQGCTEDGTALFYSSYRV